MSLGPLYVFLREVSVQVLCPFFNWVVCLPGVESCEFFIYFGDQALDNAIFQSNHIHEMMDYGREQTVKYLPLLDNVGIAEDLTT